MTATPPGTSPPVVAVSMGDPLGIGPEVIVRALADPELRRSARFRVYGLASVLEEAAAGCGIAPYWWRVTHNSPVADTAGAHDVVVFDYPELEAAPRPGPAATRGATPWGGTASARFVEDGIGACLRPVGDTLRADALATAPISKQAWKLGGYGRYPGHTELLAERCGVRRAAMVFVGPTLRVALATVHVPLMDVRNVLTIGRVFDAIDLGAEACRTMGLVRPRIAVCGLNPHAGEAGLLGDEETRLIEPAIRLARDQGLDARGPFPADTIFRAAADGAYDLVVAMYHDQGLLPVKLLDRERTVNLTAGLPIVRTSPAHGTAYDIAGRWTARAHSMREALELAARLAARSARA